jgi:hypothetical protein
LESCQKSGEKQLFNFHPNRTVNSLDNFKSNKCYNFGFLGWQNVSPVNMFGIYINKYFKLFIFNARIRNF